MEKPKLAEERERNSKASSDAEMYIYVERRTRGTEEDEMLEKAWNL